jgi:coatomer subunit beta
MALQEACYTIIHQDDNDEDTRVETIKSRLEKGSDEVKIDTMKKILVTMLNGDPLDSLLMYVIRFVMPSKNKQLKKLLHFYWEICPKTNPGGKLKQEMILVWYDFSREDLDRAPARTCSNALFIAML